MTEDFKVAKIKIVNVKFKDPKIVAIKDPESERSKELITYFIAAIEELRVGRYTGGAILLYDKEDNGLYTSYMFNTQKDCLDCLELFKFRHLT